ncbi:hypothetical protein VMCG_06531 [Cytospora schulzeri]|uniref:Uncharacterized protein n=1 Tax=Cytospora schulzeri TaxID=448051 RepID=A0A423WBW0_9PEZI|nr:hypothetical protein VMCG_06531 [Valsa malicola]
MDDDDLDSGLFNISISDSEGEDVDISHGFAQASKADRKGQSEAQFQIVKRDYRPKVENGEINKSVISLPLGAGQKVPKQEAQELLHAVEELYFFRRYDEAVAFVGKVLDDGEDGLEPDFRDVLRVYERKCLGKLGRNPT